MKGGKGGDKSGGMQRIPHFAKNGRKKDRRKKVL